MKLRLFKVAKLDACIRPLFANLVTYEDVVVEQRQSSGSELGDVPAVKKKKLIQHKPPWRSCKMQCVLDILDRKIDCWHDARAKKMCLEVVMGPDSTILTVVTVLYYL